MAWPTCVAYGWDLLALPTIGDFPIIPPLLEIARLGKHLIIMLAEGLSDFAGGSVAFGGPKANTRFFLTLDSIILFGL